jgi:dTDP-glucose 4,6-dehydratase
MRVLLTGIGGSIGCHVFAHIMHNTSWEVVGIDSFRHKGLTDRVEQMLSAHSDWRARLEVFTHDLTAPISFHLFKKIGNIDYIINLASLSDVNASLEQPAAFIMNNVQVMTTMLDYARLVSPLVFLQMSTDEVYGPTNGLTSHKEWDAIVPSNPYSASKAAQEAIAIAYWRSYGVPLIIVNTMNNFGEMQSPAKFPAMVQRKVSIGEQVTVHGSQDHPGTRFYIHSRNTADALLFLLKNVPPDKHTPGMVDRPSRYNVVGDKQLSNLELARTIARLMNCGLQYTMNDFHATNPGHDYHYGLDGAKLAARGWVSPTTFMWSMRHTIEWQQEHSDWLNPG